MQREEVKIELDSDNAQYFKPGFPYRGQVTAESELDVGRIHPCDWLGRAGSIFEVLNGLGYTVQGLSLFTKGKIGNRLRWSIPL